MSANQDQQQKGPDLNISFRMFNTQAVRQIFSDKDLKQLGEESARRDSNNLSPNSNYRVTRRTSTPTINKLVGSNRLVAFNIFIIYLKFFFS